MRNLPHLHPHTIKALAMALAFISASLALASPTQTPQSAPNICATIDDEGGRMQVLDSARSRILDSAIHAAVPCGSWVSVDSGFVALTHRDGHKIWVSPGAFLQLPDPLTESQRPSEPVVLIKGEVLVVAAQGGPELRVLTANARARVNQGRAFVLYSDRDEETQLTALEGQASLENRFQSDQSIALKPGEATALNLKILRVVPETPQAVSLTDVRTRLQKFPLPEKDQFRVLEVVKTRGERKFASALVGGRAPASSAPTGSYERHPLSPRRTQSDQAGRKAWMTREVLGGTWGDAGGMLFPTANRAPASHGEGPIKVIDPLSGQERQDALKLDKEKKRLIEELTRLPAE